MPIYIGDYMSATMHLTTEQHGAYLMLLMAAWKSDGILPDDDSQLAAICRFSEERWIKTRQVICRFFVIEGGTWKQNRLTVELEKAKARKIVSSTNGAHGGRPRKPAGLSAGNPEHNLQESSSTFHLPPSSFNAKNPHPENKVETPFRMVWNLCLTLFGQVRTYPAEQERRQQVEELVRIGATTGAIEKRVSRYKEAWPNMPCTLKAVLKQWDVIPTLKPEKPQGKEKLLG